MKLEFYTMHYAVNLLGYIIFLKVQGVPKDYNLYNISPYFNLEYCLYNKKRAFQPKNLKVSMEMANTQTKVG